MIYKLKTKYALESIAFAFVFMVLAFPAFGSDITVKKVIELVNIERQERNIASLSQNETLSRVAERKAKDMIEKNYFAHTSPEGKTPWHWFSKENYDYKYAGENLAINFVSAEKQMDAWMKSETHKKNILNQNFSEIGVAVAAGKIDEKEAIITVQEFGAPTAVSADKTNGDKNMVIPEKANVLQEETKIVPTVLSEKRTVSQNEKPASGKTDSVWKIQSIEFAQSFFAFLSLLALILAPMAFISKALERFWELWENRERRVRVRYVN